MFNFNKLSKPQIKAFEQIATNNDAGHNQQTLDSLEKRGLIESRQESATDTVGAYYITRYDVPPEIHRDWHAWCGRGRM